MSEIETTIFQKVLAMFRPYSGAQFLSFDGADVICGPNDRAMIGYDTHFPKQWLIEDHGFTAAEADWFVQAVQAKSRDSAE